MTYNFLLSDGATTLSSVLPLESDGHDAVSVPRQVLEIAFGPPDAFVVADDVTSRFIAGFIFEVVDGPFLGTYTVDVGGATYDGLTNRTTIPVTTSIVAQPFNIVDVTTGLNGVWEISGAVNGDCVYYPGASFTVAGNSDGPSNGVYTVQSSAVSGSYSIFSATPGPGGAGTNWTLTGNVVDFFNVGEQFKVTGQSNPGAGTYTIFSVTLVGLNTQVEVVEAIVGTANTTGVATPFPAVTRITVTGVIPGTAASDGTASVPPSVAYTFASPPTMLTLIAPNTYTIIWHLTGNFASRFTIGCPVTIVDNNVFDNVTMFVTNAVDVGPNTDVTVQFKSTTTPPLPNATGSLVYPPAPIPFGHIQYSLPASSSLKLVGRGSPAFNNLITWGHALQENDIHLVENFNNTIPPVAPLQGQLWFNQGTNSLFLFTSTIYDIVAVSPGTDVWTISGNHAGVFSSGLKFAVYNNKGIDDASIYSPTLVFQTLSAANVGPNTEITIDTTPSLLPPFVVVSSSIPPEADDTTPFGNLYVMTDWNEIAFASDVFTLDVKQSVRAATTTDLATQFGTTYTYNNGTGGLGATITSDAPATINPLDGVTLVVGDRVLVKNETGGDAPFNGIYVLTQEDGGVSPVILTRATDADSSGVNGEVSAGLFTFVEEGTVYGDTGWLLVTDNPIVLGTDDLDFILFAPPAEPNTQIVYGIGGGIDSDPTLTYNVATGAFSLNPTANATPGNVDINAADGSGVNINGGDVNISAGTATGLGTNGIVTITGGNGDFIEVGASINITGVAGATGSNVNITAGNATGAGTGGVTTIRAGSGGATGTAGDTFIYGGAGGSTSGDGGFVYLFGGTPTNGTGGPIVVRAADGVGTNKAGGSVQIEAGASTGTAAAGPVTLTAGSVSGGGTGQGGSISLQAGTSGGANAGGGISIGAGTGGATGAGGVVDIVGGSGGSTSGAGGAVTIQGGLSTDGNGGAVAITGRNATGTSRSGGVITITAGNSTSAVTGAAITATAGGGGSTGIGGAVTITAGAGGSTSGAGGSVTVRGGLPTSGNGGGVSILGRTATVLGQGGDVTITAGSSAGAGGATERGGRVTITGGTNTSTATLTAVDISGGNATNAGALANSVQITGGTHSTLGGGSVTIQGGPSATAGTSGGSVTVRGGLPTDGNGGNVTVAGRDGVGTDRSGGTITQTGGNATGTATGGNITLTAGTGGVTGTAGSVTISGGTGGSTSGSGGNVTVRGGTAVDGDGGAATLAGRSGVGSNRAGGNASVSGGNATGSATAGQVGLQGGAAGGTGIGGAISITSGAGGTTSGASGNVTIATGATTDGNAGTIFLSGANASGTNRTGSPVTITAGNSSGTATGAAITATAGGGGPTGTGGAVSITGGSGGSTSGAGGAINITSGLPATTGNGGAVNITASNGVATGIGGSVFVQSGNGGATVGNAGGISLTAGNGQASGFSGGSVQLNGGSALGAGLGGEIALTAGDFQTSTTSTSGGIFLQAGSATTGAGGVVSITSGEGGTSGGDITLRAAQGTGSGTAGRIQIRTEGGFVATRSGSFSSDGDARTVEYVLRTETTDATLTEMFLDGTGGSRRMVLPNDTTWHFEIKIVARRADVNDEGFAFKIEGAIDRNASAATTALIGATTDTTLADDNAGAWTATATADTTNGALRIRVAGQGGKTIRWVAFVRTVEVTG